MAGEYQYGQLPVLYLDDGTQLCQSMSILRYVCANHKTKNGDVLYPGLADPMLSWEIDNSCDDVTDSFKGGLGDLIHAKVGTDAYDTIFTEYILKKFPEALTKLEAKLGSTKYMVSNNLTMADIFFASLMFMMTYNDDYEHCHILQAVVQKYPKVQAYVNTLLSDFKFWRDTYSLKK